VKSAAGAAPSTIDEYMRAFPRGVQKKLSDLRTTIRRAAPDAVEKIAYRMPTFFQKKNLVHFAAYEHHIGFYPTPSAIVAFRDELSGYVTSKGAIQFPIGEPLPLELVSRIVKFRVAENEAKAAVRKGAGKKAKAP
jgi:uncharacterized protein YdhG (YjbR/CyaY superfamily)